MFKKHAKVNFQIKGITSLIEGNFFGKYFYLYVCIFFTFFCIFVFFVCLGGFPLNMVVVAVCCGLFRMFFSKAD